MYNPALLDDPALLLEFAKTYWHTRDAKPVSLGFDSSLVVVLVSETAMHVTQTPPKGKRKQTWWCWSQQYRCSFCPKLLTHETYLRTHIRRAHNVIERKEDGTYDQSKYWQCSTRQKFVKKERHDSISKHTCADEKQHWVDSGFLEKHQAGWTQDEWTTAANIFCCQSRYGAADSSRMPWCFASCKKAEHKDRGRWTASGRQHTRQPTRQTLPAKPAAQPHSLAKSLNSATRLAQLAPRAETRTSQQFGVRQHEPPHAGIHRGSKRNRFLTQTGSFTTTAGAPRTIQTNVGSADLRQVFAPTSIHSAYIAPQAQQTYGSQLGNESHDPDYGLQQQLTYDTSAAELGKSTDILSELSGPASSGVLPTKPFAFHEQVSEVFLHTRGPQATPKLARSPVHPPGAHASLTYGEPHGHTPTRNPQRHPSSAHRRRHDSASLSFSETTSQPLLKRQGTAPLDFNTMSSHAPQDVRNHHHPHALFDDGLVQRHHHGAQFSSTNRAPPQPVSMPAPMVLPFRVLTQNTFRTATEPKDYDTFTRTQGPRVTATWPTSAQGFPSRYQEQYR